MSPWLKQRFCALPVLCCALLCGCGSEDETVIATFPVQGQVTYNGEAIKDASVVLHPLAPGDPQNPLPAPRGTVDQAGAFQISTFRANDGAPVGDYLVTVSWSGPLDDVSEEEEDALPERLPKRFQNPDKSGLKYTVKEGENESLVLALTK